MLLARASDQKFFGLLVTEEAQHGIFFHQFVYAVAQLVFVGAGFGFDGEGDSGLRQLYSRILDWRGLVSQCIASERVFQLRHRADIASVEFIHWYRSLTLHHRNMVKIFRCAVREVLYL